MKQILENWKRYLVEDMYEPRTITFDFDNTIVMSYMDYVDDKPVPVFQSYNDKIIKKIK